MAGGTKDGTGANSAAQVATRLATVMGVKAAVHVSDSPAHGTNLLYSDNQLVSEIIWWLRND